MNRNRPTASQDELVELAIGVLNGPVKYARSCAAILLGKFDTDKASLELAKAWEGEPDDLTRRFILDALRSHTNETAKRLLEAMQDEIDNQRGKLRLKLVDLE